MAAMLAAPVACDDHEPAAPGLWDVAGVYPISSLLIVQDGDTTDRTADTYGSLVLVPDSTIMGLLYVDGLLEAENELTVRLDGTWRLRRSVVTLYTEPESFLTGIDLDYDGGLLVGVIDVDSALVLIELEQADLDDLDDGSG